MTCKSTFTCDHVLVIRHHTIVVGHYDILLVTVCVSIHPSVHLCIVCPFVFSFPDDNLSKYQWIFTKFGICIEIVEISFGIANGQILSIFDKSYLLASVLSFPDHNLGKYQWIFTKLGICIVGIWFGVANGYISSILTELSAHHTIVVGYYHFIFLF